MNNLKNKLPQIPNKRYFTIGEVSYLCAVKPHVLRYWEQEFPLLRPSKRRGNRRYYQREDVTIVRMIRELLYDEGYTIIGARIQLEQLLKHQVSNAQQNNNINNNINKIDEISFVVEPESDFNSNFNSDSNASFKPQSQPPFQAQEQYEQSQRIFNPQEFLESQGNQGNQALGANEYCTLTELEQIAEQLKLDQISLNKHHHNKMRTYKLTMDEIVFELQEILSEISGSYEFYNTPSELIS